MNWKKYDYSIPGSVDGLWIKEPRVDVELSDGRRFMSQFALIDSGAYISMIDEEIMDIFGIYKESCKKVKVGGIVGNSVEGYLSKMNIQVKGFDERIDMPVIFVPQLKTGMLLGQIGFFENFKVRLENGAGMFYLGRVNKK